MSWVDPLQGNPRFQSIRALNKSGRKAVVLALDRNTGEQVAIRFIQRGKHPEDHQPAHSSVAQLARVFGPPGNTNI